MEAPVSERCTAASLVALVVSITALPSPAADITVKGTTLSGKIADVTRGGIELETIYGSGVLTIPFADVEAVESEGRFLVLYGEDDVAAGRLLGVDEEVLLVGESPEDTQRVPFDAIVSAQNEDEASESMAGVRRRLRYWKGNLAFGFDAKQATTDTTTLTTSWLLERRKKPWRWVLSGRYFFDTEKQKGEDRSTLDNELKGRLRGEYDLFQRVFAFGTYSGEYDEVEKLSFRGVPTAGLGYRLVDRENALLQVDMGGGHVYERFFGGDDNDFWTAVFGTEGRYELPFGATFRADAEYLPAVDDWSDDYLIRSSASISAPLTDRLSLQLSVFDFYDSTPAEDTDHNELKTSVSLGWSL
jgi:putative salt-induced outer membrane protein YdiY